jgi:hypothetical protein
MARTYATLGEFAEWTGEGAAEAEVVPMLRRASALVDNLIMTARYPVDSAGMPTEERVREALRDAVCAQVAWWAETGDASGASGQYTAVSLGSLSLERAPRSPAGDAQAGRVAPEAVQTLATAGLLAQAPGAV